MRTWAPGFALLRPPLTAILSGADRLTEPDRIELMRGLSSEYATVKQFLPRSKKPLPFESTGTYDKKQWEVAAKEFGPAARVGDLVQVNKVVFETEKRGLKIQ